MSKSYDIEDYERTFEIDTAASDETNLWIDIPSVCGTVLITVDTKTQSIDVAVYPGEVVDAPWGELSVDLSKARKEDEE